MCRRGGGGMPPSRMPSPPCPRIYSPSPPFSGMHYIWSPTQHQFPCYTCMHCIVKVMKFCLSAAFMYLNVCRQYLTHRNAFNGATCYTGLEWNTVNSGPLKYGHPYSGHSEKSFITQKHASLNEANPVIRIL